MIVDSRERRPTENRSINIKNPFIDFPLRTEIHILRELPILFSTFLAVATVLSSRVPGDGGVWRDASLSSERSKLCLCC